MVHESMPASMPACRTNFVTKRVRTGWDSGMNPTAKTARMRPKTTDVPISIVLVWLFFPADLSFIIIRRKGEAGFTSEKGFRLEVPLSLKYFSPLPDARG
jgi:hypothetical protein